MPEPLKIHSTAYLFDRLKENFFKMVEAMPEAESPEEEEARGAFYAITSGNIHTLVMVIDKQGERITALEEQVQGLIEKDKQK